MRHWFICLCAFALLSSLPVTAQNEEKGEAISLHMLSIKEGNLRSYRGDDEKFNASPMVKAARIRFCSINAATGVSLSCSTTPFTISGRAISFSGSR